MTISITLVDIKWAMTDTLLSTDRPGSYTKWERTGIHSPRFWFLLWSDRMELLLHVGMHLFLLACSEKEPQGRILYMRALCKTGSSFLERATCIAFSPRSLSRFHFWLPPWNRNWLSMKGDEKVSDSVIVLSFLDDIDQIFGVFLLWLKFKYF